VSATVTAMVEAGCAATLVAAASAPAVLPLLRHRHLLDVPTARSSHVRATPRGGGICCVLGTGAGLALASPLPLGSRLMLGLLLAGFATLGLVDDLRQLAVRTRLLVETVMAGVAVIWLFHASADARPLAVVLALLAVIWIVGYVNVFNFMDGINGLAGCSAAVSGLTLALIGLSRHDVTLAVGGTIAAGAAAGFLPWNFPHARFFLGDVGSYLLGLWIALLVVIALLRHVPFEAALAPQAVFVADAGWTLAGRLWRGEDWTAAHRNHVYQRLHQLGWSHTRVTALLAGLMVAIAALGSVSLWGSLVLRAGADALAVALLLGYLASPRVAPPIPRATAEVAS
jgi:UDP-GlcNAc:undecaprenyl-phosphate GlcNAc-1-phosphate transferase